MANLTREEIIKRGYVTDPFVVNSNVDVDSELFKAAITDRFYYDLIYRGDGEKSQVESAFKEKVIEIQEPITIVGMPVDNEAVETSTESVLLDEDLKEEIEEPVAEEVKEEVIETPIVPEKKSKKSTKKVEEVDPVEPVVEETKE